MVTATLASIPGREHNLQRVVEAIRPQVDRMHVYLNGHTEAPGFLDEMEVAWTLSRDSELGDMGDAGKFFPFSVEGYRIIVDDDLEYPSNFVEYLIQKVDEYDCVVCLGGKRFDRTPVDRFIRGFTANYRILNEVKEGVLVHAPLTCGVAFHTDRLKPTPEDFPLTHRNMADLHLGRACQERGIPVLCASHDGGFVRHQGIMTGTIWGKSVRDDSLQTELVNSVRWAA